MWGQEYDHVCRVGPPWGEKIVSRWKGGPNSTEGEEQAGIEWESPCWGAKIMGSKWVDIGCIEMQSKPGRAVGTWRMQ